MSTSPWVRAFLFAGLLPTLIGCSKHTTRPEIDTSPPGNVRNFAATTLSDSAIRLSWNENPPGDIASYEIRYSLEPYALTTADGWNASTRIDTPLDAVRQSSPPSWTVSPLDEATTYYFAIKVRDAAGNVSATSTVAAARTLETPPVFLSKWGSRGSGPGQFLKPSGLVVAQGVYVADAGNWRIQRFGSDGHFMAQWGSKCDLSTGEGCVDPDGAGPLQPGDGQFGEIRGIAAGHDGDIYVTDFTNGRIVRFTAEGQFVSNTTTRARGYAYRPEDLDIDPSGAMYVSGLDGWIHVYGPKGNLMANLKPGGDFLGVGADGRGDVFAFNVFEDASTIYKLSMNGALLASWGGRQRTTCSIGALFVPQHIHLDARGSVYVPDGCGRVQKFDNDGMFLTQWGTQGSGDGQFDFPRDVSTSDTGLLYVLEDSDNPNLSQTRIQMFLAPRSAAPRMYGRTTSDTRVHPSRKLGHGLSR